MGERSPFSSLPTDPVPTFIFSFYVGGKTGSPHTRQRDTDGWDGRVTQAPSGLPSKGPDSPMAFYEDVAVRAAVGGRPPAPSVRVCLRHGCRGAWARRALRGPDTLTVLARNSVRAKSRRACFPLSWPSTAISSVPRCHLGEDISMLLPGGLPLECILSRRDITAKVKDTLS